MSLASSGVNHGSFLYLSEVGFDESFSYCSSIQINIKHFNFRKFTLDLTNTWNPIPSPSFIIANIICSDPT
jgi:hypothetical protein